MEIDNGERGVGENGGAIFSRESNNGDRRAANMLILRRYRVFQPEDLSDFISPLFLRIRDSHCFLESRFQQEKTSVRYNSIRERPRISRFKNSLN